MLQVSLLGPLEVRRDSRVARIPAGKTSEVLVRLALDAGGVVRTERLVEDLWGPEAVNTRRNTLQSKVAKLRRALGDPSLVVSGGGGYTLATERDSVDALVALGDAAEAARLLDAGEDHRARDLSASALARFRGDVLPDAGEEEWATLHRARLEAARIELVQIQLSARVRLGDLADVIGELEAAVRTYPFQEGLWELLITAQYRAGRQAEALATYQRVRAQLADELGLEPGPQLRQLEQQILVHDAALGVPYRPVRPIDPRARSGNLPSLSSELVGRDADVDVLSARLAANRLVEVIGPGGVGKTAVAIATGRQLHSNRAIATDGIWLARLETAATADDVVDALVAAMDVVSEAALFDRLRASDAVVILDNCEHVLDAAAALAVRLLDAAPGLRILCTSQVPLDVDGELIVELSPLGLDDAAELFRRLSPRRSGTEDDLGAVVALCRSLDGLPLAIELAAARTRTLSIDEIARRLDDRFAVLSDPTSRRPERRRALRSTIRWSYELLFPDDQRGLWALATFAGGASLPAIESVLEALEVPAAAVIDVVGRLASRSLVIVDDEGASMSVRYRLLDSIRAFALEAMGEAGMSERALGAHAAWFARAAAASTAGVRSADQAEHLALARTERANIDAALAWSTPNDPGMALSLARGFGWAWVVLGDSRGAQRLLAALDATSDAAPAEVRADALLLAAWIEASTGRLELARDHIATATALAETTADVDLQARAAYYLAYVVSHHGEFRRALELTDRSDALYAQLDRPWDQAANWLFAARAAISAGDERRGVEAVERVERWLQSVDDPWLRVRHQAILGELARMQHRYDDAVTHLGRAVETSRRLGFAQTEAYQVSSLGRAQSQAGDDEAAATSLALAVDKAEAIGDLRLAALARVHLGRVLRALGRDDDARTALEAAVAWHREAGGGEQAALGECLLAAIEAREGDPSARQRLRTILESARRDHLGHVEVFALDALARAAAEDGDGDAARAFSAAADARMTDVSHFITERDRTDALVQDDEQEEPGQREHDPDDLPAP